MRLDDELLGIHLIPAASSGSALVLNPTGTIPHAIESAIASAGLSFNLVKDIDNCLNRVPAEKPDIIVAFAPVWGSEWTAFEQRLELLRTTETLPVLAVVEQIDDLAQSTQLLQSSNRLETFLALRSLIRRERVGLLRETRKIGPLTLNEDLFKISYGAASANITKTELCLLGPFFDVKNALFDRTTLERLAFGPRQWKQSGRIIDVHVSRMRRNVKRQLCHDPLRPIRGIGYAICYI